MELTKSVSKSENINFGTHQRNKHENRTWWGTIMYLGVTVDENEL